MYIGTKSKSRFDRGLNAFSASEFLHPDSILACCYISFIFRPQEYDVFKSMDIPHLKYLEKENKDFNSATAPSVFLEFKCCHIK